MKICDSLAFWTGFLDIDCCASSFHTSPTFVIIDYFYENIAVLCTFLCKTLFVSDKYFIKKTTASTEKRNANFRHGKFVFDGRKFFQS